MEGITATARFPQGGKIVTLEIKLSRQNQNIGGRSVLSFQSSLFPQSNTRSYILLMATTCSPAGPLNHTDSHTHYSLSSL